MAAAGGLPRSADWESLGACSQGVWELAEEHVAKQAQMRFGVPIEPGRPVPEHIPLPEVRKLWAEALLWARGQVAQSEEQ